MKRVKLRSEPSRSPGTLDPVYQTLTFDQNVIEILFQDGRRSHQGLNLLIYACTMGTEYKLTPPPPN
ncbi:hypothetical protein BI308_06380 [Roseofilum reptotaenium AO1-A]|uniref:Uncharacterized protein n=1 Tax=Roseofilum reptotaenium AO1-A TaxID=1925591 RepID=A0A1L9QUW3_9CYAN|nr:hypothetical protein BI308_06380 [Roseofilum reptotaenium AO1-A]